MDSFAEVVENTRALTLSQEREARSVPSSPLPIRCSSKLKLIIERQISLGQTQSEDVRSGRSSLNVSPYVSPYGSPCSSPRIKRKPLKVSQITVKPIVIDEPLIKGGFPIMPYLY